MNIEDLVEELSTTLLWENVSNYIESVEEVNKMLDNIELEEEELAQSVAIQDSEDFVITGFDSDDAHITVEFEMPFIMCVNNKFNIESTAVGKISIPSINQYSYENYDFSEMDKKELLSFGSIIELNKIHYVDTELLGYWE